MKHNYDKGIGQLPVHIDQKRYMFILSFWLGYGGLYFARIRGSICDYRIATCDQDDPETEEMSCSFSFLRETAVDAIFTHFVFTMMNRRFQTIPAELRPTDAAYCRVAPVVFHNLVRALLPDFPYR